MLNKQAKLSSKVFKKDIDQVPTRNGYGEGLVAAGEKDENVVVLCADLTDSTRSAYFRDKFPERFIEIGVAEQALATVASGMANYGKIPFIASYAAFSPGRNWEQIRTTIALNDVPVNICGAHAGISVGPDGATHQMLEDISIMRAILESSTDAYLNKGDETKYFELGIRGMDLKIELQNAIIEGNKSLKKLLTYGHLHAHILEEYFEYTIPHSHAVYLGLLVDLKLAGPTKTFIYLLRALERSQAEDKLIQWLSKIKVDNLKNLYSHASKHINNETGNFYIVTLPKLGHYKNLEQAVTLKESSFGAIAEVYNLLKDKLN